MKVGMLMKRTLSILLVSLLLAGCGRGTAVETTVPETTPTTTATKPVSVKETNEIAYTSRFEEETRIHLSDDSIIISVPEGYDGNAPAVVTRDIIYYEDRETYDSGNPYGEGTPGERHTAEEAAAHQVVNITKPGTYRVTGTLSKGQIRIDLGKDAEEDENAVVELILDNADITCTVAPAIVFLNVYECDEDASEETATAEVETSAAGANLILEGQNTVNGSHVAKIFKDKDGEKKLWKQDAAIYSYMSMNVFGPGALTLTADNEGLGTEMHLTIHGGDISIESQNDGINTNEDGVSVTTINGSNLTIFAGLGAEGDGIDSNGYLVINGGNVFSSAKPASDAGLDSDLGSFIHGGTVIAMGSAMDWAESDSKQVTMNFQFAQQQKAGSKITITKEDGTEVFSLENSGDHARTFSGLILSHEAFTQGETYHVYVDGVQMAYTGNDVGRGGHSGMGKPPEMSEGMEFPQGERPEPPEDFDPGKMGQRGQKPGNWEDRQPPEDFDGEMPEPPEGGFGGREMPNSGENRTDFYMNDKVNAFSGVTTA